MNATKRKPKPITANPLFPFVTALWFAMLLGLGSFAAAPVVLEGPVVALGIPALLPAATPPLGFTARIMFAFAMLIVGSIFGFGLGRFLGREKVATPARTRGFGKNINPPSTPKARRPINATEDLGAPLDAPVPPKDALRQPTFASSSVEDMPVFEEKPDFGALAQSSSPPDVAATLDPLGLELLLQEADTLEQAPFVAPQPMFVAPEATPDQPPLAAHEPVASVAQSAPEAYVPEFTRTPVTPSAFDRVEVASPPAFARPATFEPTTVEPATFEPAAFGPAPAQPKAPAAPFLQARAVDATPIGLAPLENLGLVQLVERLALAISRRELRLEFAEPAPSAKPEIVPSGTEALQPFARFEQPPTALPNLQASDVSADGAVSTKAFAQVQSEPSQAEQDEQPEPAGQAERVVQLRPAALQPLELSNDDLAADDFEDGEQDAGLERFLRMSPLLSRKPEQVAAAFKSGSDFVSEPEVAEDCYPSLLDMGPVVSRREPLRIDDSVLNDADIIEPVVVFPGQEAPRPAEPVFASALPAAGIPAAPSQAAPSSSRPFERPSVMPIPGSPLASRGRAAPSEHIFAEEVPDNGPAPVSVPDAEEADRALRAALATLQRMTARG